MLQAVCIRKFICLYMTYFYSLVLVAAIPLNLATNIVYVTCEIIDVVSTRHMCTHYTRIIYIQHIPQLVLSILAHTGLTDKIY